MSEIQYAICPYCWQSFAVEADPGEGNSEFVEDCAVCCRPIVVRIDFRGGQASVSVRREND